MKNKKADIRQKVTNTFCFVYVLGKRGKLCSCREKTPQLVVIAFAAYMCKEYEVQHNIVEIEKNIAA